MNQKALTLSALLVFTSAVAFGQRVMSEGTIIYNVSVVKGMDKPGIADAFNNSTYSVYMKGATIRTDLKTSARVLSTFYFAKDESAVILKESGNDKFLIKLTPAQWDQYNQKNEVKTFNLESDTKTIAGHSAKKATGVTQNGYNVTVYYATDVKALYPEYDYSFSQLPGLPLEYELNLGDVVIRYTAASIQTSPVLASKLDVPKSGYKLLDYKQ